MSLEDKFDRHKEKYSEDITEVKVKIAGVEAKVENVDRKVDNIDEKLDKTLDKVDEHITGDNKIITHIEPILPHLAAMAEDFHYRQMQKKKYKEMMTSWKMHLGFFITLSTVGGILYKVFA